MPSASSPVAVIAAPDDRARSERLTCSGRTDPGSQRPGNQDRFGLLPDAGLVVVADGMGGANAGDVAARMAIELMSDAYADGEMTWPTGADALGTGDGLEYLVAAVERANRRIHRAAHQRRDWRGMGTTIAAVLALGSRAALVHVGDSRIYRLRGHQLDLCTEDHSLFNELVRLGLADPEHPEAFTHHNVLTRALGMKPTIEVDSRLLDTLPGDTFLVCSDGLWGVVDPGELAAILVEQPDLDEACARLVDRANDLGGPDNVTAVLLRIG
jgi:protein phosphatase